MLKKPVIMMWWVEYKSVNGMHIFIEDFERSGWTLSSDTDKNVEKVCQVIHDDRQHKINDVCNWLPSSKPGWRKL
jgi:hypothetical protein